MNKLTRQEVYSIIDSERTYQDNLDADRKRDPGPDILLTQAEFFPLIDVYLNKAKIEWANNPGEYVESAQAHIRKIAAMCVQSMEKYGSPKR